MHITEPTATLLYRHEILRSTLQLKNHFLTLVEKELYEQTGQLLSLVRIRLATLENDVGKKEQADISDTRYLVGEVLSRLKVISKHFFPEQELMGESGLVNLLNEHLQSDLRHNPAIEVSGISSTLGQGLGVILASILVEIICSIKRLHEENSVNIKIQYTELDVFIHIGYRGHPIDIGTSDKLNTDVFDKLSVKQRLNLIKGDITVSSDPNNTTCYHLRVSLENPFEEY